MSKFAKSTALAMGGEVVTFLGSFLFGLITARMLGPYGKGIIAVLVGAYGMLVTILSLRFERAIVFYTAARPDEVSKSVAGALVVGAATACAFFPIYFLMPPTGKQWLFGGIPAEFIMVAVLYLPNAYLSLTIGSLLAGQRRFGNRLTFQSIVYGTKVATAFLGLVVWHLSLREFIIVSSVVDFVLYASLLAFLCRHNRWTLRWDWQFLRDMIRYSSAGFLGIPAELILGNFLLFMLSVVCGSSEAGLFSVAIMLSSTLAYLADATKVVVLPHTASSPGMLDDSKVLRMLLFIEALMTIGFLIAGRYLLVLLYGPRFEPSFLPAVILVPGVIGATVRNVLSASIQGRGEPGKAAIAAVVGSVFAVACGLAMVPPYGILGAAVASSIANIVSAIAILVIYVRMTRTPVRTMFFVKPHEVRDLITLLRTRFSDAS